MVFFYMRSIEACFKTSMFFLDSQSILLWWHCQSLRDWFHLNGHLIIKLSIGTIWVPNHFQMYRNHIFPILRDLTTMMLPVPARYVSSISVTLYISSVFATSYKVKIKNLIFLKLSFGNIFVLFLVWKKKF